MANEKIDTTLATRAYAGLKVVAENGLPKRDNGDVIYNNFQDYLFDFYPNLPWNQEDQLVAIKQIMAEPDYKETMQKIQNKFNFDMDADFKAALLGKD